MRASEVYFAVLQHTIVSKKSLVCFDGVLLLHMLRTCLHAYIHACTQSLDGSMQIESGRVYAHNHRHAHTLTHVHTQQNTNSRVLWTIHITIFIFRRTYRYILCQLHAGRAVTQMFACASVHANMLDTQERTK